jgi:hypothetical protein
MRHMVSIVLGICHIHEQSMCMYVLLILRIFQKICLDSLELVLWCLSCTDHVALGACRVTIAFSVVHSYMVQSTFQMYFERSEGYVISLRLKKNR